MNIEYDKVKYAIITQSQFFPRIISSSSFISKKICLEFFTFEASLSGSHMLVLPIRVVVSVENIEATIVRLKARYKKHSQTIAS